MSIDRRTFIQLAGLGAMGLAGKVLPTDLLEEAPGTHKIPGTSRLAMVVDLRRCGQEENCQKCIDACHTSHNVPDFGNPKDEIKWVWKETFEHAFHETGHEYLDPEVAHGPALVTCNHCDNPPCVRVCPTQATWKRDEDGIVMMDWHRCIGCRYCVVACPYGSRSFNWRDPRPFIANQNASFPTRMRGVVEKCTFCEERLSRGQMPACVEACTAGALAFGDLHDPESAVRRLLKENFTIRRRPELGTQPQVYYIV